jgi:outer membrane immunogenic protein
MFLPGDVPMRKLVLAISIIALGVSAASAADLETHPYAPVPMIAAGWDWSGFYAGLNAGYGSSHNCWDLVSTAGTFVGAEGCHNATGAIAGGQAGYRTQIYGWVFGLEAQVDWSGMNGSRVSNAFFFAAPGDAINRTRIDVFGLFTGQVGYAWGNTLLYFKGGAAVLTGRYNDVFAGSGVIGVTAQDTRAGGTAGAGIEFSFAPNWSFGVEYDHLFMGNRTVGFSSTGIVPGLTAPTDRIRQDVDLVSARINYVFGGPSIAKY